MEESHFQEILLKSPVGYSYQQLITGNDGEPVDFLILNVNPAFEKLTGLTRENLVGKKISELLPGDRSQGFDYVAFFGDIALSCGEKEITRFENILNRWLKITGFSAKKGFCVAQFQDITEEVLRIEALEAQKKELKNLADELERVGNRVMAILEQHSAVMLLIDAETENIVSANPAACNFYGYSKEEFLKLKLPDINMISSEEIKRLKAEILAKNRGYYLFPHRLKNGEIRFVDVYPCPFEDRGKTFLFSIIFDASERERYKSQLIHEKNMLQVTLESIAEGMITTDHKGKITSFNKAAEEITGWKKEEALEKPLNSVTRFSKENGVLEESPALKVLRTGEIVGPTAGTFLTTKDGRLIPVSGSAAPIKDENGRILGVVKILRNISAEFNHQKEILYLSYHDSLTYLFNRRFLEEKIQLLDSSNRVPVSIIMGDLNGLKLTNDVFGHAQGDQLLRKAAEVISEACRKGDLIGRWGGDEFLILLPETTLTEAEEIVARIQKLCSSDKEAPLQLSITFGAAQKRDPETSLYEVIKEAEELMYHHKFLEGKSHRNSIINTLLATLYAKGMETKEHADRLKTFCFHIGVRLGLTKKELDQLELLALLHNIGKVGINENILQKPGPLTEEEWAIIRKHPEIGFRIAQNTPELVPVAEYILFHHERWDGRGYPRGLKNQEIPLLARVLAVADAYDAMTSDRPYRKAMAPCKAASELLENSGTQFDPDIVKIFLELMNSPQN